MVKYSEQGVWLSIRGSSIVHLYDANLHTLKFLFNARTAEPLALDKYEDFTFDLSRITSILGFKNYVWLGTGDGYLYIYQIRLKSILRHSNASSSKDAATRKSLLVKTTSLFNQNPLKKTVLFSASLMSIRPDDTIDTSGSLALSKKSQSDEVLFESDREKVSNRRLTGSLSIPAHEKCPNNNMLLINSYLTLVEMRISKNIETLRQNQASDLREEASVLFKEPENRKKNSCSSLPPTNDAKSFIKKLMIKSQSLNTDSSNDEEAASRKGQPKRRMTHFSLKSPSHHEDGSDEESDGMRRKMMTINEIAHTKDHSTPGAFKPDLVDKPKPVRPGIIDQIISILNLTWL